MEKHSLKASKRTVTGKKVKSLRNQGLLPTNIYGKNIKSQAVQVNLKEFQNLFTKVGETGLVDLVVDEKDTHPVLIHNVQLDPVSDLPIHADFYQVSLKEKITTMVPVIFIGESPAVANKEGVLLTILDKVEVEALPTDLPEKIELNISKLTAVDQELKVQDLKVDTSKITIKSDSNLTLVKVGSLITEEMKKTMEEEAAKAAAAAQEAAAAAGAPPTGEAAPTVPPTEEKAPAEAPKTEKPKEAQPAAKPAKSEEKK